VFVEVVSAVGSAVGACWHAWFMCLPHVRCCRNTHPSGRGTLYNIMTDV
jgi:hypothetical protein